MAKGKTPGRATGSHKQALRVLALVQHLEAHRGLLPTSEVARELGVSERQIRRDADALIDAGYAIELDLLDGRSALRLKSGGKERVALGIGQRIALVAARNVFAAFQGTDLRRDLDGAVRAVAKTLEPKDRCRLETLERRIAYVADGGVKRMNGTTAGDDFDPDDDSRGECLNELVTGLVRATRVAAKYVSSNDRVRAGAFAPYGLALYRHGLYFVGAWGDDTEQRIFAAERFVHAERARGDRFEVPKDFDVRTFFGGAFGVWVSDAVEEVVLEFGPGTFDQLSLRRYHASQEVERTARDTTVLRMRVGTSPDLVSWVLGWGAWVVVHAPDSLRQKVEVEHQAAVAPRAWTGRPGPT
jgi:predicted DNA-binding transcriptional regulator YafY